VPLGIAVCFIKFAHSVRLSAAACAGIQEDLAAFAVLLADFLSVMMIFYIKNSRQPSNLLI